MPENRTDEKFSNWRLNPIFSRMAVSLIERIQWADTLALNGLISAFQIVS